MIPRTRKEKFLHLASVERFQRRGSKKYCVDLFLVLGTRMSPRIGEEKFLHRRSVEWDLRRESIKDCAGLLLGIKHHNDSLNKRGEVPTPWMCGKGLTLWRHKRLC